MKQFLYKILIVGFFSINYNCSNTDSSIEDIWIGDYYLTQYDDITRSLPHLLDLTDTSNCKLIYFSGDTILPAGKSVDSILIIDTIKYRLISITKDSLVLSPLLEMGSNYVYKRINKAAIEIDAKNISNDITNRIWHIQHPDKSVSRFFGWVEFLDNGISLFKFKNDTNNLVHIQEDHWKIFSYNDYSFLVFYQANQGSSQFNSFQILDFNQYQFKVDMRRDKYGVFNLDNSKPTDSLEKFFMGTWRSINDTSKYYSKFLPHSYISRGYMSLYSDTLRYQFFQDSLYVIGKGFEYSCNWFLNSDNTILIFEHHFYYDDSDGVYVEYASILDRREDYFGIELFDNYISTGKDKQHTIVLNRFQNFTKLN